MVPWLPAASCFHTSLPGFVLEPAHRLLPMPIQLGGPSGKLHEPAALQQWMEACPSLDCHELGCGLRSHGLLSPAM